jgi:hypothetical protein
MYFLISATLIPIAVLQFVLLAIATLKSVIRRLLLIFFLTLAMIHTATAQEYGYRHYDVKDGLAGSAVYDIYQDKEGFMWTATETGVSRFDGTHFRNFTVKDGLPDNSIIRIYGDSQGRIWLIPFKHAICYYYQGKIYNQQNDTALQKIKLTDYVIGICEDTMSNIWLLEATGLYQITPANKVILVKQFARGSFVKMSRCGTEIWLVAQTGDAYQVGKGKFIWRSWIAFPLKGGADQVIIRKDVYCWLVTSERLHIKAPARNLEYEYDVPPINTIREVNDSVICLNTTQGTILFNIITRKNEKHFLVNKHISKCLPDKEGGLWFSTLNEGIYHLGSTMVTNFKTILPNGLKLSVNDLQKYNNAIWAALDMGYLLEIRDNTPRFIPVDRIHNQPSRNPVSVISVTGNSMAIGNGRESYLKKGNSVSRISHETGAIKDIAWKNDAEIIVAASNALYESSGGRSWTFEVLWMGRTTCLFYRNDSIYFGTLNGLYILSRKSGRKIFSFGDTSKLLQSRISDIKEGEDGIIWVATSEEGIIALKNNRIVRRLNESNGLSSNLVRCMAVDTGCIWVGTNKGVNKVDLRANPVTTTKYSSSDGLSADIINAILIDGDNIYIGTPDGIDRFNKRERFPSAQCHLKMQAVYKGGKELPPANYYNLNYKENNIRFDYVAISYKAANDIIYSYRLKGEDTTWKTTRQTSLEFISLPSGKHKFELQAINKFGVNSELYTADIYVQSPYWQTAWFFIGCLLVTAGITWGILTRRNIYKKAREAEKQEIEQELLELEQKALRAQINPHFIFNCLNSVQSYIIDKDMSGANKYLAQFAHLIRQTLDNSMHSLVTVADEMKYINTYLGLEQMRSKNKFTFTIQNNLPGDSTQLLMPGMLLQPFIENAIHHGIQNKPGDDGHIDIDFFCHDKMIDCVIKDNGIGRKKAMVMKLARSVEYRSRGMQLVLERIQVLNKGLDKPISVQITDRVDALGQATGTIVQICFPENKADHRN